MNEAKDTIIQAIQAEHAILDAETQQQAQLLELRPHELDPKKRKPKAPNLLRCKDVEIVQVGDMIIITGKAKSGKTSFVVIICASILGCCDFCEPLKPDAKILYFDTEQSADDSFAVRDNVHELMGWDKNERNPRFRFYNFRDAEITTEDGSYRLMTPHEIAETIENEIDLMRPDAVILDGCTDLMEEGINDVAESTAIVRKLLHICSKYNIALITVVHENEGEGSTSPRGHVGRELVRKCNSVISVTKCGTEGDYYYTVKNPTCRHKNFETWSFRLNDDKLPYPYDAPDPKEAKEAQKVEELRFEILNAFSVPDGKPTPRYLYGELRKELVKVTGKKERTVERHIKQAVDCGILTSSGGIYTLSEPTPNHPPE